MIRERIRKAILEVYPQLVDTSLPVIDFVVDFSSDENFGDYFSNIALVVFETVQAERPGIRLHQRGARAATVIELANKFKEKLEDKLKPIISKIEVAGPGFINFWLSKEALVGQLERILEEKDTYGASNLGKRKTVVIDYSSPNIAKRFGIGHLRSTVIGQTIYNLYKFLGYKVIGDNHLGDWGTQFGVLLAQIAKTQNSNVKSQNLTIDELEKMYVEFHKRAEENPKLWDEAREHFKKLEEGDRQARKIWQAIVDISMAEFDRIYRLLGLKIGFAYGESFYEDKMPEVIKELKTKGLLVESQGAKIVEFPDMPPAMVIKSDGTTTYFTRDLATIKFRLSKWDPDIIIYEVGSDQTLHFRQLFRTVEMLGWKGKREFTHVAHGLIRFPHGKMSTRRGQTVKLEEVLNEAIQRARKIKDDEKIAKAVGIGAIKYFDLMHHPTSDIIFDWEKMFVLEGNSAPYLQYTFARTQSVLRKLSTTNKQLTTSLKFNREETVVLRGLSRFPEIIVDAAKNYSPNLLANYLFDLAQKYNNFYNVHRIVGSENEVFRLALTTAVGSVLKNGLTLLGIQTPERM